MACSFCQIASGDKGAEVLYRTDRFIVFPPATQRTGKLLIAPVAHYESLDQVSLSDLGQWMQEAKDLAVKLKTGCYKIQINVVPDLFQGKHIYMQFTYAEGPKEVEACHHQSASTAVSSQRRETTAQVLSPEMRRRQAT